MHESQKTALVLPAMSDVVGLMPIFFGSGGFFVLIPVRPVSVQATGWRWSRKHVGLFASSGIEGDWSSASGLWTFAYTSFIRRKCAGCLTQRNGVWSVMTQLNIYLCYIPRLDLSRLHSALAMMPVPSLCMLPRWSVVT
ncbi:hypothetical protein LY78DRAFT_392983 [Colletotrichum sublineola]|nr:hypothetical protein LY78DRAFT_392983 [Colletotrichum sublineola]